MKKYYVESRKKGTSYIQYKEKAYWIGCVLCRNCLQKLVTEGKIGRWIEMMGR
jgi:hypothetical protein